MTGKSSKIKYIKAREILDARGVPTIEVSLGLENGLEARASTPSSLTISEHEMKALRDGDRRRYFGQGVQQAITKVEEIIAPAFIGQDALNLPELDQKLIDLDGSKNYANLGVNTMLAVSVALARVGAMFKKQELFTYLQEVYELSEAKIPQPIFNLFNGGKHADTNLDFQEYLLIPKLNNAREMVRMGAEVFQALAEELKNSGYDTDVGVEGGYAPDLNSSIEAIELILASGLRLNYQAGTDFTLGIDIGSSVLFEENSQKYVFPLDKAYFAADNLIGLYNTWLDKYPITYLEDGLSDSDWENWQKLTAELGNKMIIAGDDLYVTQSQRLEEGINKKASNAIVVKADQAGTVSQAIKIIKLAQENNFKVIVSHRSGETNDDFISDLAVASGADYLKAGSLSRGERVAKYNRLLVIEEKLFNK